MFLKSRNLRMKEDSLGRSMCANELAAHGLKCDIKQVNTSLSLKKGTVRGMHYQNGPFSGNKINKIVQEDQFTMSSSISGKNSPTYKQWVGVELTQDNL